MAEENKKKEEPIIIKTVEYGDKSSDVSVAVGFKNKGAIFCLKMKAAMAMLFEHFNELRGKNNAVHIFDASSGKKYVKDEDGRDMFPEKNMSTAERRKVGGLLEKLKGNIVDKITPLSKKVFTLAAITLAAGVLFAGGLDNTAQDNLNNRYSSFNAQFNSKGNAVMLTVNGGNKGAMGDFAADFCRAYVDNAITEYEKAHGKFSNSFHKEEFKEDLAGIASDALNVIDDGQTVLIALEEEIGEKVDYVIGQAHQKDEENREKEKIDPKSGPDPLNFESYGGLRNSDGSYTFTYSGRASENAARAAATNLFNDFINDLCHKYPNVTDAKTQSGLTNARNGIKTQLEVDGTYTARITVPKDVVERIQGTTHEKTKSSSGSRSL